MQNREVLFKEIAYNTSRLSKNINLLTEDFYRAVATKNLNSQITTKNNRGRKGGDRNKTKKTINKILCSIWIII